MIRIDTPHRTLRPSFVAKASFAGALAAALAMGAVAEAHLLAAGSADSGGVARIQPLRLTVGGSVSQVRWWHDETFAVLDHGKVSVLSPGHDPEPLVLPRGVFTDHEPAILDFDVCKDDIRTIEAAKGRLAVADGRGCVAVCVHGDEVGSWNDRVWGSGSTREISFSPDGRVLGMLDEEGSVRVYVLGEKRQDRRWFDPWKLERTARIALDGDFHVVTASVSRPVELRSLNGTILATLGDTNAPTLALTATKGTAVTTGFDAGSTRIWDLVVDRLSGAPSWAFRQDVWPVAPVRFRHDGKELVFLASDGTIRVLDVNAGVQVQEMRVARSRLLPGFCSIDLSPDGRRAVVANGGPSLELWDLDTGRELTAR